MGLAETPSQCMVVGGTHTPLTFLAFGSALWPEGSLCPIPLPPPFIFVTGITSNKAH